MLCQRLPDLCSVWGIPLSRPTPTPTVWWKLYTCATIVWCEWFDYRMGLTSFQHHTRCTMICTDANVYHVGLLPVEISTRVCFSTRWARQWMSPQPMMIEHWFNFLSILPMSGKSLSIIKIYLSRNGLFYEFRQLIVGRSMVKFKQEWSCFLLAFMEPLIWPQSLAVEWIRLGSHYVQRVLPGKTSYLCSTRRYVRYKGRQGMQSVYRC